MGEVEEELAQTMKAKPEIQKRALRHYFMERHALPARRVGMYAKTPKICSCFLCGNPRRFIGEPTIQERRAILDSG